MNNDVLLLTARILLAILFLVTGLGKLADPSGVVGMLGSLHLPAPTLLAYLVGSCEVGGALAVIAGYQVRTVGLLLAAWCVATALIVHLQMPMDLMKNLGLAGGFTLLAATGAGSLAVRSRQRVSA
ncbi:putative oxidoreductase [Mesorhizobium soli]|uniref:DoxX family protein n=1 Tax=Pseudaminobacter soli (ex Li et al. 2025) TaxID=1295366 RepID=UPI0024731327|nr:DoxX family protein [Mesorhizobium soli]MDH6234767.1 putative oxidoreductase [Mesorhizobium soli]